MGTTRGHQRRARFGGRMNRSRRPHEHPASRHHLLHQPPKEVARSCPSSVSPRCSGPSTCSSACSGSPSLVVGVLGLFINGSSDLNLLYLNQPDNVLHLASAALGLYFGLAGRRSVASG